jgi:hypothetical protein
MAFLAAALVLALILLRLGDPLDVALACLLVTSLAAYAAMVAVSWRRR